MSQKELQKITGGKVPYLIIEKLPHISDDRVLYLVKEEGKEQKYIMKQQNNMKPGEEQLVQHLIQIKDQSDCLTQYYDFFTFNRIHYTIQEYCSGGNLRDFMKKLTQMDIYQIVLDICQAIKQLNSLYMFHRDIKPDNIVIQINPLTMARKFKLCDYGEIRLEQDAKKTLNVGTPSYQAPEVIKNNSYDKTVDIWSLGAIIYELFQQEELFDGQSTFEIQNTIVNIHQDAIFDRIDKSTVDNQLKPILKKILSKEPSSRPSIDEIKEEFQAQMDKFAEEQEHKFKDIIDNSIKIAEKWLKILESKLN